MSRISICAALALMLPIAASAAPRLDRAAMEKARAAAQAFSARVAAKTSADKAATPGPGAAETFANPYRAYPVSCLDSPLPVDFQGAGGLWRSDPNAVQKQIVLFGDLFSNDATERSYSETDTVTLFRVACANGYSATLLEIDRPPAKDFDAAHYPTLPGITVTQQGITQDYPIRYADDPNTFVANNYAGNPLIASDVFVLEKFYNSAAPNINYNNAFTLTVNDFATSQPFTPLSLPIYDATQYPDASKSLPISGHMTTAWTNPDQGGEGIFLQVYDVGSGKRVLAYAWFTYDDLGMPFWIYGDDGDTPFTIGARSVTVPTFYFQGGAFDGANTVQTHNWGTTTFSFPDCNNMLVSYTGDASAVQGPHGSATNHLFQRIAYVNGVGCL